ncbi:MAG: FAD-binding oxidoreductase [Cyanobacteria bacterium]|nr:FAD-binding oxidoreductase [Cyanobacteriota bacterium]
MTPDANELQDLVRELHQQGTAWVPCGSGSRLDWGAPLRGDCLPVSCAGLSGIVEHNPGDFTISVRAGTPLEEVQEALAIHRQWLAVDRPWGSQRRGAGSLGGLVARGLSGGFRQRYLGIRDQLIGISLLRADGTAARAGGRVVKNVAGYDLMRLFCGSWGSLGLITELNLRTLPQPLIRRGLLVQGSLTELGSLSQWLLGSGLSPERLDWWSAPLAASAGLQEAPLLLIALASISAESLEQQQAAIAGQTPLPLRPLAAVDLESLLALARSDGAAPASGEPAADGSGESLAEPAWLLRLGITPDRVPEALAAPELAGLAIDLAAGSGLGLAWTLPAAGTTTGLDPARLFELRRLCQRLGGWLIVLQQPQGSAVPAWDDAPSRPMIERVKHLFDPKLQLAPGRLPGVANP